MPKTLLKYVLLFVFALLLVAAAIALLMRSKPLPKALLADGRILQIEGITFGTNHQIGSGSRLQRFSAWLPQKVSQFFTPKYPRSQINLQSPALVVWVNAVDPATGQHVDCQSIRVEIVGEHGDLFGSPHSS